MAAWGSGNFANDDAMDFLWDIKRMDASQFEQLLKNAAESSGYFKAPDASVAVAAAEVVAALKGAPAEEPPEELTAWVESAQSSDPAGLVDLALKAARRVKTDSELKDLWAESEEFETWLACIDDLEARLAK